jgi:hypothetical protein
LIINELCIRVKYMPNSLIFNQKSFKKTTKIFGSFKSSLYLYYIRDEGIPLPNQNLMV